jgi:hypothetical protein
VRAASLALLALLLACSRDSIDRAQWQRMPHEDRVLYVQSLVGGERAKAAKGGHARRYDRAPSEYVAAIDTAYARGEQRDVPQVFEELGQ